MFYKRMLIKNYMNYSKISKKNHHLNVIDESKNWFRQGPLMVAKGIL